MEDRFNINPKVAPQSGHVAVVNPSLVPGDADYRELLAKKEELQKQLETEKFHEKISFRQIKELNELVSRQEKELVQLKQRERRPHLPLPVIISIVIGAIALGALISYWITNSRPARTTTVKPAVINTIVPDTSRTNRIIPPKIATTKEEVLPTKVKPTEKLVPVSTPDAVSASSSSLLIPEATESKGEYKVRSKAYFYNGPDDKSRRAAFIVHWNNAVLQALDDQNGYIYVVFTNHLGQTSKGWLNKKELVKLHR